MEKVLGGEIEVSKCSCDGWFKRLNTAFGVAVKMIHWAAERAKWVIIPTNPVKI